MDYRLKKDLPDLKTGAVFSQKGDTQWYFAGSGTEYTRKEMQDTEWFEPIPERIELVGGLDKSGMYYCRKNDNSVFVVDEINLMEQAINGDLVSKEKLEEYPKWLENTGKITGTEMWAKNSYKKEAEKYLNGDR